MPAAEEKQAKPPRKKRVMHRVPGASVPDIYPADMPRGPDGSDAPEEAIEIPLSQAKSIGAMDAESAAANQEINRLVRKYHTGEGWSYEDKIAWGRQAADAKYENAHRLVGNEMDCLVRRVSPEPTVDYQVRSYRSMPSWKTFWAYVATECDTAGEGGEFDWTLKRRGQFVTRDKLYLGMDANRPNNARRREEAEEEVVMRRETLSIPTEPAAPAQPAFRSPTARLPKGFTLFSSEHEVPAGYQIMDDLPGVPEGYVAAIKVAVIERPVQREVVAPPVHVAPQVSVAPRGYVFFPDDQRPASGYLFLEGIPGTPDGYVAGVKLPAQYSPPPAAPAVPVQQQQPPPQYAAPPAAAPELSLGQMTKKVVTDFTEAKNVLEGAAAAVGIPTASSPAGVAAAATTAAAAAEAAIEKGPEDKFIEKGLFRTFEIEESNGEKRYATMIEALPYNIDNIGTIIDRVVSKHRDYKREQIDMLKEEAEALKIYADAQMALKNLGIKAPDLSERQSASGGVASGSASTTTRKPNAPQRPVVGGGALGAMRHAGNGQGRTS
jgi:hypothetical protein